MSGVKKIKALAETFRKNAMAYSRKEFKDNLESVLIGAAVEFYKCRLHDKLNANHVDRAYWEKEWRYHLDTKARFIIYHEISFSRKGERKACDEVIEIIKKNNGTYMRGASNTLARYLSESNIKLSKILNEDDAVDFVKEVTTHLNDHLLAIQSN